MFDVLPLSFALHLAYEALGGLEARKVVGVDHYCLVLRYVACRLLRPVLHHEAAEAAQVHVLPLLEQAAFDDGHERLNRG